MRYLCVFLAVFAMFCGLVWAVGIVPEAKLVVPESTLLFTHDLHVTDQEMECSDCHINIESSQLANDKNLPTHDECESCHDFDDDEMCFQCHRNPDEPEELTNPERPILFNHEKHIAIGTKCERCHVGVATSEQSSEAHLPKMAVCFECHDGTKADDDCALCHGNEITLADIHPDDWRHQHGDRAALESSWCVGCHQHETACIECHRGDNLTGNIHELNYYFTHGLDAQSRQTECARCHDTRSFCNGCHESERRMPLRHSTLLWRSDHGEAARADAENCAVCHDSNDPTCARGGCHSDFDGIRGTDPALHDPGSGRFDGHGSWHDDRSDFCYQCHTNTAEQGQGFCGYCHD